MRMADVIHNKRSGKELAEQEIQFFCRWRCLR